MSKVTLSLFGLLAVVALSGCGNKPAKNSPNATPKATTSAVRDTGTVPPAAPKTTEEALNNLDKATTELDNAAAEIDSSIKNIELDREQSEEVPTTE